MDGLDPFLDRAAGGSVTAVETIIDCFVAGSKPVMLASMRVLMAKMSLSVAFVRRLHLAIRIPAATHSHD
jgi:hypothetical protein